MAALGPLSQSVRFHPIFVLGFGSTVTFTKWYIREFFSSVNGARVMYATGGVCC
jgi:hypothetical protein